MKCVTFIACLAVIGCDSKDTRDKPAAVPVAVDGVELVSAGTEPRRVLRYAPTAGTETALELGLDVDLQTVDTAAVMPTLNMSLAHAVPAVDASGTASVKVTV